MISDIKTLHFHDLWISEPLEARIYGLYYIKILQTICKYMGTSRDYYFCKYGTQTISKISVKLCVLDTMFCSLNYEYLIFRYENEYIF